MPKNNFFLLRFEPNSFYRFIWIVRNTENIRVRVGSAENTNGGSIYKVKRTIQHEHFDKQSNLDYDFALIELEDGIKFDEKAQPIELVHENQEMIDGTMCLVTGWGRTQSANESRRLLRGVEVPIANYQQCMYNYRRLRPVTPRMFCAGYEKGGKDACQGNSVFKTICITMNWNPSSKMCLYFEQEIQVDHLLLPSGMDHWFCLVLSGIENCTIY